MRKNFIVAALIVSLLTGSAAMGQKKYQPPPIKTPDEFRGAVPCKMLRGLAHLRYEGGVDTLLNALIADTSLFSAELNLAQTKRNELLSLVQLYKALGGGWQ